MSNRFHSKWHRRNHHTYGNDTNPDASHDPIASQQQPFLGEFVLKGALSATCPLSSFAAFLYTDNTALCAYAGTRGAYIHSEGYLGLEVISTKSIGISANAPKIAIEALSPMRAISAWGGQIGLDVYSPTRAISAFGGRIAGEFYSPIRALSAYGGQIGLDVYSSSRGISSYGGFISGEFYSPVRALSAWGGEIGLDVYSPTRAISAFGGRIGGEFYSPIRALSAYGGQIGLDVYSSSRGISAFGGFVGGEFYSPFRALSAYGKNIGLDAYSSNWGVNSYGNTMGVGAYSNNVALSAYGALTGIKAEGGNVGASFHSPMISLSTGGGGINVFNSRVGIYKVPQPYYPQQASQVVLDVNGDVRIDGNTTITGDLSALGTFSYLDTKVQITSSLVVNNKGTDAATTIIQTGAYPILQCFDQDIDVPHSKASLIVDGATNGWVGVGVNTPTAPFNIVKANTASEANGQPQVRIYDGTTNKITIGTFGTNASNPYIGTENSVPFDIVTNNTQKVTILSNGNVGINHATPTAKLAIFGDSNGTTALSAYGSAFGAIIAGGDTRINYDGSGSTYINSNNTTLTNVNIGNSNANGTNVNVAGYVKINDGNTTASFKDTEININGSTGTVRIGNNSAVINAKGAPIGINNDSGTTTNTNIGTGTTTGTVSIGNSSGTLTLNGNTGSITTASTFTINGTTGRTTNINTGTGAVTTTIGNAGTVAINGTTTIAGNTTIADTAGNTLVVGNQTGTADLEASTLTITTASTIGINTTTGRALNINNGTAAATNINTGTGAVTTTIGNAAGTVAINGTTTIAGNTTIANTAANTLTIGNSTGVVTAAASTYGLTTTGQVDINSTTARTTNINTGTGAVTTTIGNNTASNVTVVNSPSVTAPNQTYLGDSSVITGGLGDTRYGNLIKGSTLGGSNATITLANIVNGVSLDANTNYEVVAIAILTTTGLGGVKYQFTGDGSLKFNYFMIDDAWFTATGTPTAITYAGVGADNTSTPTNLTTPSSNTANTWFVRRRMHIRSGTVGGTLNWQFALGTAGGGISCVPLAGSYIIARKLL